MPNFIDKTGRTYGKLTVISKYGTIRKRTIWNCLCECGNTVKVDGSNLENNTRSCGCSKYEHAIIHGGYKSQEYSSWKAMKSRCYNEKHEEYSNYGGRGIKVCDRWLGVNGFALFLEDMGKRPTSKHTIERKDNNGMYEPDNCIWANRMEQARNKRTNNILEYKGIKLTVTDWAIKVGIKPVTLFIRLSRGWGVEKALETKTQFKNKSTNGILSKTRT